MTVAEDTSVRICPDQNDWFLLEQLLVLSFDVLMIHVFTNFTIGASCRSWPTTQVPSQVRVFKVEACHGLVTVVATGWLSPRLIFRRFIYNNYILYSIYIYIIVFHLVFWRFLERKHPNESLSSPGESGHSCPHIISPRAWRLPSCGKTGMDIKAPQRSPDGRTCHVVSG